MTTTLEAVPAREPGTPSPVMTLLAERIPLTLILDLLASTPPGPSELAGER